MSSQKWFPVAITVNQTQAGQASQSTFAQRRRDDRRHHDADDERVGGVQARHRRVRVRRSRDRGARVVDGRVRASVSTKPASGNIRGGAVGSST